MPEPDDPRYQFQPWPVRWYRWWRYMPFAYVRSAFWVVKFAFSIPAAWDASVKQCHEMEDESGWPRGSICPRQYFWNAWGTHWTIPISMAQSKMQWTWTLEECLSRISKDSR